MKKICGILVSAVYLLLTVCRAEQGSVGFWRDAFKKDTPSELVKRLVDDKSPDWPPILTPYGIGLISGDIKSQEEQKVWLPKSLTDALGAYFKNERIESIDDVNRSIQTYSKIRAKISVHDCYVNAVLADALTRICLLRAEQAIFCHSAPIEVFNDLVRKIPDDKIDVNLLLEKYKSEDPVLNGIPLEKIKGVGNPLYAQLKEAGVPEKLAISWALEPQLSATVALLEKPSVVGLIYRRGLIASELLLMQGVLIYLQKGGKFDDASLASENRVREVLGADRHKYAYRFLDSGSLSAARINKIKSNCELGSDVSKFAVSFWFRFTLQQLD